MCDLTDRAIEQLRKHGHARRSFKDFGGRICLMESLHRGVHNRDELGRFDGRSTTTVAEATLAIRDVLAENYGFTKPNVTPGTVCVVWNDYHARDVDQVIEVLKLAGERLDLGV